MDQVLVEGLIAELDEHEEYWVDEVGRQLYIVFNSSATRGGGSTGLTNSYSSSSSSSSSRGETPPDGNNSKLAVVTMQNLLAIVGEGAGIGAKGEPTKVARDITIRGVGFR